MTRSISIAHGRVQSTVPLPYPHVRLAHMQDFQWEGEFFNHLKGSSSFISGMSMMPLSGPHSPTWHCLSICEVCPFQPSTWKELKALLLKHFQLWNLTQRYKASLDLDDDANWRKYTDL